MRQNALSKAIETAGGATALAKALKVSKQAVSAWHRCPSHQVLRIERLTGVSRHKLRPDIFGPAPVPIKAPELSSGADQ